MCQLILDQEFHAIWSKDYIVAEKDRKHCILVYNIHQNINCWAPIQKQVKQARVTVYKPAARFVLSEIALDVGLPTQLMLGLLLPQENLLLDKPGKYNAHFIF